MNPNAIQKLGYGLYVVCSKKEEKFNGQIANTIFQVCSEPPVIAVAIKGWGFLIGIVLFSGSLYVLAITNAKWLGVITPFGGVAFLFGWFWLIWTLHKGHV